ncbi:cytochrome c nitrite reductase small subunit [candidate division WOR-3 bacterium]|uniref:Cytochrome c nitrite reductase small subunit n=1 Tax=candidate division WOR-3 bacterium TaxID=2052148 RepID=A0A937XE15_UNCW3|nr:cytochrome c nitrite reductase small subunit [candidate division WOR-3 bacterium]
MGLLLRIWALSFLPGNWRMPVLVAAGVLVGLGLVTAHAARMTSYLGDDPETCVNCHIMEPQYLTWMHSSHREVAHCNDCHVPQNNIVRHYGFKAIDGMKHSTIFALRREPQVVRTGALAVPVIEANCRRCHWSVIEQMTLRGYRPGDNRCWDCHRETPHGRTRSLSATPGELAPRLPDLLRGGHPRLGGRPPRP